MALFDIPEAAKSDPNANSASQLLSSSIVMLILSGIAIILRFISRRLLKAPALLDDWLLLAALPFAWGCCAIIIYGASYNHLGRHIQYSTPETLTSFLRALYAFGIFYDLAITISKFSIIALYWRLFVPQGVACYKWPLIGAASATLAWGIACVCVSAFSCNPVYGAWDLMAKSTCINSLYYYIGQASGNIFIDLVLLAIPILPVLRLQITRYQKFAICGIFLVGGFVTLCSILRLKYLIDTTRVVQFDLTYDLTGAAIWSVVETNLSIVCACMPSMRPLLRWLLHGNLGPTYGTSGRAGIEAGQAQPASKGPNSVQRASVGFPTGEQQQISVGQRSSWLELRSIPEGESSSQISWDKDDDRGQ